MDMVVHAYNPRMWEADTKRSWIQNQPTLNVGDNEVGTHRSHRHNNKFHV